MEKYLIQTKDNNLNLFTTKNIKEAVRELFNYYNSDIKQIQLFSKSLDGLDSPKEFIDLYNTFTYFEADEIKTIFRIKDLISSEN